MKTTSITALTALLSSGALAVPMAGHHHAAPAHGHLHRNNKRDNVVWTTTWEVETVTVVKTVFEDGSEPEPTGYYSPSTIKASASAATTSSSVAAPIASSSPSEAGSSAPAYTPPTTTTQVPVPTTSSTSAYVAPPSPTTTTTQAPAPTSYSEPAPAPTTYSSEAAPAPSPSSAPSSAPSSSSGYSGDGSTSAGASYTGDATNWAPDMGACGLKNTADEAVVAISHLLFDPSTPMGPGGLPNPNLNTLCGRYVRIKGMNGGKTVDAKVVDRCTGCEQGDLDMTISLFNDVTNFGDGRVGRMEWQWL